MTTPTCKHGFYLNRCSLCAAPPAPVDDARTLAMILPSMNFRDQLAALRAALRAAEERMKERCAQVAETWGDAPPNPAGRRAALARAIRALSPSTDKGGR